MLLAVDVGNTQTVLGLFDGTELVDSWRVRTDVRATSDQWALIVGGLLGDTEVTGLVGCSTVPSVRRELTLLMAKDFGDLPTVLIGPGVRTGVALHVDNPKEVGADRVVNSLAAFEFYGGPSIVVDFGTSTSLDVVGARGEFLGGALAPGMEISAEALTARAAQLRMVELLAPPRAIGKNTVAAMQSGVVLGFAGLVDGLVERIVAELRADGLLDADQAPPVIATGGLAPVVCASSRTIGIHDPDLTLHGLRLAFEHNQPELPSRE